MPETIGWDVGGAHLKAARVDAEGRLTHAVQRPSPLWQGLDHLRAAVRGVLAELQPTQGALNAITMTGDMADCFATRAEGVAAIVASLREVLEPERQNLRWYAGERGFLRGREACHAWPAVASANWLATAQWVARKLPDALLVDIGSTTTDIIPIASGRVAAHGRDDAARLVSGELVYSGIIRTPLAALASSVPFAGESTAVMAEWFATTADVYRITGELDERHDQQPAADGGEKTRAASLRRLARMVGRDAHQAPEREWEALARHFRARQVALIETAFARVRAGMAAAAPLVAAGCGRFLVRELAARLGVECVDFAPAVAVARLAALPADSDRGQATVVRLGGSLAGSDDLRAWVEVLAREGAGRVVIVPGGGRFADQVRDAQRAWRFDDRTAHRMALLAMAQFGLAIAARSPVLAPCEDLRAIRAALAEGRVAVWLPSWQLAEAAIEENWAVTSDSLAAWLTRELGATRLVIVKSCAQEALDGDAASLAARGVVDAAFPTTSAPIAWRVVARDAWRDLSG